MKTWLNKLHLNNESGQPLSSTQIVGCVVMVAVQVYLLNTLYIVYQNALPM